MSAEDRLKELGITLPQTPPPVANYVNHVQAGNLLFLAGKGPLRDQGQQAVGKLGRDWSPEEGYQLARSCGIAQLAAIRDALGSLDRVAQVVKVLGMVNAIPEFTQHPQVINGFSDLMVDVFGDRGRHARSAVGMSSLPGGIAVEVEMVVEIMR